MFNDADEALGWAARIASTDIYEQPTINGMCGKPKPSTRNELLIGLTPEQGHMQAYQILNIVRHMRDESYEQYISVRYYLSNDIRKLEQKVLAGMLYSGSVQHREISKLIYQYLGRASYSQRVLRSDLKCQSSDVHKHQNQVYSVLDKIHQRVLGELEAQMIVAGLVRGRIEVINA